MDDLVLRGMAKWPNVPAVHGWLSLDRRGEWHIRGNRIANRAVRDFIGRNYACNAEGCWFFQNGPQRVFVALAYTPFVYRIMNDDAAALTVQAHTGAVISAVSGAWIDENGAMLIDTPLGIGIIDDRDLPRLVQHLRDSAGARLSDEALVTGLELLARGHPADVQLDFRGTAVSLAHVVSADVPHRFGFVRAPGE
jgi:hypothetical protein